MNKAANSANEKERNATSNREKDEYEFDDEWRKYKRVSWAAADCVLVLYGDEMKGINST